MAVPGKILAAKFRVQRHGGRKIGDEIWGSTVWSRKKKKRKIEERRRRRRRRRRRKRMRKKNDKKKS